jgi:chemotaxis protein methyltransferase CheR
MLILQDKDIDILLADLLEIYGYDFTNYSRASLSRRVSRLITTDGFPSFAEFRFRLRSDPDYLERFVEEITVNVTEMFRDFTFYKKLKQEVIPTLGTYPLIRIWHAGCSTGEEVYSMAILLQEANLLHKSLLYATDINPNVLKKANLGMFPLMQMKQYSENYIRSGGEKDFSDYYTARYNFAKFNDDLRAKMIFSTHNLVSDGSFNEFQLIMCRNVFIYFNKGLQNKVLNLFDNSLEKLGYLALGAKESLHFFEKKEKFRQLPGSEKIYRKIS